MNTTVSHMTTEELHYAIAACLSCSAIDKGEIAIYRAEIGKRYLRSVYRNGYVRKYDYLSSGEGEDR